MKVAAMCVVVVAVLLAMGLILAAFYHYCEGNGLQAVVAAVSAVACIVTGWFAAWIVDLAEERDM